MAARHDPSFVRDARRIGTEGHVVSAHFDHAQVLPLLLRENVAENAALFGFEIVAPSTEFVEDAARHKDGCGELGSGVFEFLSGSRAVILENADVFEPAVALQILKPQRSQTKELFDFGVPGIPQMAVVARILEQTLCAPTDPMRS